LRCPYLGGGILGRLRLIVLGALRQAQGERRAGQCGRRRLLRNECGDYRVAGEGERWKGEVAGGAGGSGWSIMLG